MANPLFMVLFFMIAQGKSESHGGVRVERAWRKSSAEGFPFYCSFLLPEGPRDPQWSRG